MGQLREIPCAGGVGPWGRTPHDRVGLTCCGSLRADRLSCYRERSTMQNPPHTDARVVILGGGLTGISTAYPPSPAVAPRSRRRRASAATRAPTRRAASTSTRPATGCTCAIPYMKQLVAELLPGELVPVERKARIFSHGVLTRYPFQGNLHGLPPEVVSRVPHRFRARAQRSALVGAGAELRGLLPQEVRRRHLAPLHDPVQPEAVGRAPARDHRRVVLALRAHPEAGGRDQGRRRRRAAGDWLQRLVPLSARRAASRR